MKTALFAALAVVSAYALPAQAQQAKQDFTIVNRTGYDIKEVYVSPSKSNKWEEDVLGDDDLSDGHKTHIKFSRANKTCMWDLKVVYTDDDSDAVWNDVNLCKIETITLKFNRAKNTTSAVFD
jgi:hypothetical protein